MDKKKINSITALILIGFIFIIFSYLLKSNFYLVENYINYGPKGMITYVMLTITAVVIAPVSTIPLVLLASETWGWLIAATLSLIGWTIGSAIAFLLARKYGFKIIKRLMSMEKIQKVEERIQNASVFWSIVLLRIIMPISLLSYALGIFTKISFRRYLLATLIGLTPFALLISYAGTLPWYMQITALIFSVLLIIVGIKNRHKITKRK